METDNTKTLNQADSSTAQQAPENVTQDEPKSFESVAQEIVGKTDGPSPEEVGEETATEDAKAEAEELSTSLVDADKEKEGKKKVEEEEQTTDAKSEDEPVKTEEVTTDTRFDKHPRFVELNTKVKELEPLAKQATEINTYCQQNGISPQAFQEALGIVAMIRQDPVKAKQELLKTIAGLDELTGEGKLPDDLQAKVDAGEVTEVIARDFNKARVANQMQHQRVQMTAEQHQKQQRVQLVSAWEAERRAKDPEFEKKYQLIAQAYEAQYRAKGNPTPQECINMLEKSYKDVNESLAKFIPKAPVKKVMRSNGSSTRSGGTPKSPADVATAVLAKYN